jgi:SAM-dependent methyltransferase
VDLVASPRQTVDVAWKSDDVVAVFSRAAARYDLVGPRFFTYFGRKLVAQVGVHPGDVVLDVATGTGAVLLEAASSASDHGRCVGVDLSSAMLRRAAAEIERRSLRRIELQIMDAEQLEFPDGTFDRVFCAFALLALSDPGRALAGFHRVLKPGGRLGLTNTFGWFHQHDERWHWEGAVLRSFGVEDAVAAPRLGLADLEQMARQVGFADVQSTEDACALAFEDAREWWDWAWSHGYRVLLEAVAPERREQLKRELFDGLERACDSDGRIHGSMTAHLTSARKTR